MNEKIEEAIAVGKRGLSRFYDDGITSWSLEEITPMFLGWDMENPQIQKELKLLEDKNVIKIHKAKDCYLEVLRAPMT